MTPSDEVIMSLHDAVQAQRDRNNALRIENDHLRAEVVNVTRDNANLLAMVREFQAKEAARVALGSQGFKA